MKTKNVTRIIALVATVALSACEVNNASKSANGSDNEICVPLDLMPADIVCSDIMTWDGGNGGDAKSIICQNLNGASYDDFNVDAINDYVWSQVGRYRALSDSYNVQRFSASLGVIDLDSEPFIFGAYTGTEEFVEDHMQAGEMHAKVITMSIIDPGLTFNGMCGE